MLSNRQFQALSEFRYRLSRFLRASEAFAAEQGISTLQYLALLHVRAARDAAPVSIGDLAQRLDMSHQGAAALVARCAQRKLLSKRISATDKRRVDVALTPKGRALVERVAQQHLGALDGVRSVLRVAHAGAKSRRKA